MPLVFEFIVFIMRHSLLCTTPGPPKPHPLQQDSGLRLTGVVQKDSSAAEIIRRSRM